MSDTVKAILKKMGELLGSLAVLGVVGTYWINTEVERRMGELAINPADNPAVVTAIEKIDNLEEGQVRIENKVDDFSVEFIKFLRSQAND